MLVNIILNSDNLNVLIRHPDLRMYIVIGIGIILFSIYTIIKVLYIGYFNKLFYVFFNPDYSGISFEENNFAFVNLKYFTLFASVLSISCFTFTLLSYNPQYITFLHPSQINIFVLGLLVLAVVIILYFLKWVNYTFWGWLFKFSTYSKNYLNMVFNNLRVFGIVIFPFFLLYPFVGLFIRNVLAITSISLLGLLFIYTFYIFWRYSIKIKFFNHYAILYFCTFEILPLIIFWELFKG